MKAKVRVEHIGYLVGLLAVLIAFLFIYVGYENTKGKAQSEEEVIETYRIGMVESSKSEYEALLKAYDYYLSNRNLPALDYEIVYYTSGRELIEAMNHDELEIGFVDAYSIAKNSFEDDISLIATKNDDEKQNYYRAQLLRRVKASDDELQTMNFDYANATYCVMNPTSVAGYIGVMPYFEEQGLNFYDLKSVRIDNYGEGIENLAKGVCDVSVGYTNIKSEYADVWELLEGSEGSIDEELMIIYTSDKLYENGVLIRDVVSDDVRESLVGLLSINKYDQASLEDFTYLRDIIRNYLGGK